MARPEGSVSLFELRHYQTAQATPDQVVPYASVHPRLSSLPETDRQIQHLMEAVMESRYNAVKLQLVYADVYTDVISFG